MKILTYLSLLIVCMGANWDMSGFKSKWDMIGSQEPELAPPLPQETPLSAPLPTLPPIPPEMEPAAEIIAEAKPIEIELTTLPEPEPISQLDLPELPKFYMPESIPQAQVQPTTIQYTTQQIPRRIRLFGRWR